MSTARLRQIAIIVVKVAVTLALIYWLLVNADFAAIGAMVARVDTGLFVGAMAAQIAAYLFLALRWWLLLQHTGTQVSFRQMVPSYYLGLFFNNLLPTSAGGDVVRILYLHRRGLKLQPLAASMIVDRGIGILVTLFLATICAVFFAETGLDANTRHSALALLAASVVALGLALSPWTGMILKRLQRRLRKTKVRHAILENVLENALLCYAYRANPLLLLVAALLTLGGQSLAILAYILLGAGIGLALAPISYFVIIPIVFIVAALPISLGGLGVREGALVGLLLAFGADRQLAIGLSLLYLFVLWLSSLPGAAVLAVGATKEPLKKPSRQ